ncbi:hypothetical protein MRAB57_3300, partial [Mycobacterium rhizamassiliense]
LSPVPGIPEAGKHDIDDERFPEWRPFVDAVQQRRPDTGTDDVVVHAEADRTTIELADPEGPATLETDAAARVLLLWGRRPADPSRICSRVGPETLGRVRQLLSGY